MEDTAHSGVFPVRCRHPEPGSGAHVLRAVFFCQSSRCPQVQCITSSATSRHRQQRCQPVLTVFLYRSAGRAGDSSASGISDGVRPPSKPCRTASSGIVWNSSIRSPDLPLAALQRHFGVRQEAGRWRAQRHARCSGRSPCLCSGDSGIHHHHLTPPTRTTWSWDGFWISVRLAVQSGIGDGVVYSHTSSSLPWHHYPQIINKVRTITSQIRRWQTWKMSRVQHPFLLKDDAKWKQHETNVKAPESACGHEQIRIAYAAASPVFEAIWRSSVLHSVRSVLCHPAPDPARSAARPGFCRVPRPHGHVDPPPPDAGGHRCQWTSGGRTGDDPPAEHRLFAQYSRLLHWRATASPL